MSKISGWTRKEGKDSKGFRWFQWRSNVNDDISISVDRQSVKVERVGPQSVHIIHLMPGTKDYKKYLGYFVNFRKRGDQSFLLGGSVRHWDKKRLKWVEKSGKGPWTQEEAMSFAYHHLDNAEFLKRYVRPKEYALQLPGWTGEKRSPFVYLFVNDNDGRHQVSVHGLLSDFTVEHVFGYGGENPKTVMKKTVKGWPQAMIAAGEYIKKLGPIPKGQLEKNLQQFKEKVVPLILKTPDKELAAMTRLIEQKAISPEDALKLITKRDKK